MYHHALTYVSNPRTLLPFFFPKQPIWSKVLSHLLHFFNSDLVFLHTSFLLLIHLYLPSCSSLPLQGGRQVTAVGGRQACHVLLCLTPHQHMPQQVTPETAVPFNHPTVAWRKCQRASLGMTICPERSLCFFIPLPQV